MLRRFFGKCCNDNDDEQVNKEQQLFRRFQGKATRIPHSLTESTLESTLPTTKESNLDGDSSHRQSRAFITRRTPVLFTTNRGLHLRVPKPMPASDFTNEPDFTYDISFCDLERWSTNQAYTVSLEDTFTISRRKLEPVVEEHPISTSSKLYFSNRNLGFSNCCSSNNAFVKRSSYYDNAYSRFETGQ